MFTKQDTPIAAVADSVVNEALPRDHEAENLEVPPPHLPLTELLNNAVTANTVSTIGVVGCSTTILRIGEDSVWNQSTLFISTDLFFCFILHFYFSPRRNSTCHRCWAASVFQTKQSSIFIAYRTVRTATTANRTSTHRPAIWTRTIRTMMARRNSAAFRPKAMCVNCVVIIRPLVNLLPINSIIPIGKSSSKSSRKSSLTNALWLLISRYI